MIFFVSLGNMLTWFFGELNNLLYTLIAFMIVDYVASVMRSFIDKEVCSVISRDVILKKVLVFLIVGIANLIDMYLVAAGGNFKAIVVIFYIANEGLSILENVAAIGLPIPKKLKDVLLFLRNKDDDIYDEDEYQE